MNLVEDSHRTKRICHRFKLDSFLGHHVFYGVEFWSRVLERSNGVEWSQILE